MYHGQKLLKAKLGRFFFALLQAFHNKKHSQQDRWDSKSEFSNGRNMFQEAVRDNTK